MTSHQEPSEGSPDLVLSDAILCEQCLEVPWGQTGWNQGWRTYAANETGHDSMTLSYDASIEKLQRSTAGSCRWCEQIFNRLIRLSAKYADFVSCIIRLQFRPPKRVEPCVFNIVQVMILLRDEKGIPRYASQFNIGIYVVKNGPASKYFTTAPQADALQDFKRLGAPIVQRWVRECHDSHFECDLQINPRLPTRVLDVKPGLDTSCVRLHLSINGEQGKYIILSYRWGGTQRCVLNTLTLDTFRHGIAITDLPKTLADAVEVTRALGVRYLWVDALCILQDSNTDVSCEIERMKGYYSNAFVALQPSGLACADEAFLGRDRGTCSPVTIEPENIHGQRSLLLQVPFWTVNGEKDYIILEMEPEFYNPAKEVIHERAWVLQERLLCPRVLIFPSKGGFILQCERTEKFNGKIFYCGNGSLDGRYRLPRIEISSDRITRFNIHMSWVKILKDYNSRNLTDSNDKLPAIAALAQYFFQKYGEILGHYSAGQWSKCLLPDLQWIVFPINIRQAPKEKRAPSWSWPAVDGTSHFVAEAYEYPGPAEIQSCIVNLKHQNVPFGPVLGGHLTLEVHLFQLFWGPIRNQNTTSYAIFSSTIGEKALGNARPDTLENRPLEIAPIYVAPLAMMGGSTPFFTILLLHIHTDLYRRVGATSHWDEPCPSLEDFPREVIRIE